MVKTLINILLYRVVALLLIWVETTFELHINCTHPLKQEHEKATLSNRFGLEHLELTDFKHSYVNRSDNFNLMRKSPFANLYLCYSGSTSSVNRTRCNGPTFWHLKVNNCRSSNTNGMSFLTHWGSPYLLSPCRRPLWGLMYGTRTDYLLRHQGGYKIQWRTHFSYLSAEPNHIVKAIFNQLKKVVGITWLVVTALVIGQLKTHRVIDIRAFK